MTYTIQTVSSLPGGTNWVDYVQIPVTNDVNTNLLIAFNPPAGMALIPRIVHNGGHFGWRERCHPHERDGVGVLHGHELVSYSQWQSVYNWATNHGYGFECRRGQGGESSGADGGLV
jgi:hypothetical protein